MTPSAKSRGSTPSPRAVDESHRSVCPDGLSPIPIGPSIGQGAAQLKVHAVSDRPVTERSRWPGLGLRGQKGAIVNGDAPCFIVPPYVLERILEEGSAEARASAVRTLATSERIRERRAIVRRLVQHNAPASLALMLASTGHRRSIYDVAHGTAGDLPGQKARQEGSPDVEDDAVNEAYEGSGDTYDFYKDEFSRNSVDDQGLELVSSVHFGTDYCNAFWNGSQMVYGDGDDRMFKRGAFTSCLDVIAHELTHGVTQFTAGLRYRSQSGALNESFSDVFGSLVKQKKSGEAADQADWLIGEGILGPDLEGAALRSLEKPGHAFKFDTQPAHMDQYQNLPDDDDPQHDHGGVHINSGIPNHAFYLAATAIGGNAWERAGKIWYRALTQHLDENADFQRAAEATVTSSAELFGAGGDEEKKVRTAWEQVGISP